MRLVFAALVASTGCAQLFGIDETSGPDASTDVASIQVQKVSIGASVVRTPLDMTNQSATFYDDTAGTLAPIPGVQSAMDTFSATVPGTPAVIFTVPDVQVPERMLALPAAAQRANYIELEHPSPQEPLPNSAFDVNITLPSAYVTGETFSIQAIGAWMSRAFPAGDLPLPDMGLTTIAPATDILYSDFNLMVSGNPRTRITMSDVVLVLRYTGAVLSGVFQAQFDQTDGVDMLTGTMSAVPASSMLTFMYDPPGYTTRFAAVRPTTTGASLGWRVDASPGADLGVTTGVRLINGAAPADMTSVTAMYGNPFESLDWGALFTFTTTSSRTYAYTENAMTANIGLSASMSTIAPPSTELDVTMPAGLPLTITANDLALVTDGMMLPLDLSAPIVVEATVDRPTNTAYQLTLVEVSLDTTGMTPVITRRVVLDVITAGEPLFKLPPDRFTVGKSYYLTFRSFQGGYVDAATGDLQTLTPPYSVASLDSALFTVGMP